MKVGTIVEEATKIDNRSGKSIEEERREAEEKVTWISSTLDLDFLNSEKVIQDFLRWRGWPSL